ncbi:MAG: hypothetical protein HY958_00575 [Bacteroidia bacterium]|nr:hypothetical protein [Bacteroidia bacterium]
MEHWHTSKRNMYGKLLLFFSAHAAIWANFNRLVTEIAAFVNKVTAFDKYVAQQQQQTKGITTDKETKFHTMKTLIVRYSRKARVWAADTGNETLQAVFDIRKTDFSKMPGKKAIARIKDVCDALNINIGSLAGYNVLPANITAISNAITAYENAANTPGAAKSLKKTGTAGIDTEMQTIDDSIAIIDDLLITEYEVGNADLVAEYHNSRRIDNIAVHHGGIKITATDADTGAELQGLEMEAEGTDKAALTAINGIGEITGIKNGDYYVNLTMKNYETQRIKVTIARGKITEQAVKMKKALDAFVDSTH